MSKVWTELSQVRWKRILLFALYLFAICIIANRLACFVHEALGHAVMTKLLGGDVLSIHVRAFGGGLVRNEWPETVDALAYVWVSSAGFAVNMLTALIALVIATRLKRHPGWSLFLVVFAAVSLLSQMAYLAYGLYYGVGDPGHILNRVSFTRTPWEHPFLWGPYLLAGLCFSYLLTKEYMRQQRRWFKTKTPFMNLTVAAATLGIAVVTLGTLTWLIDTEPVVSVDAQAIAADHAEVERVLEIARAYRDDHPDASDEQMRQYMDQRLQEAPLVNPEDVRVPFPLKPIILLVFGIGAFFAVCRARRPGTSEVVPLTLSKVAPIVTIAALVITYLSLWDTWYL